MHWTHRFRKGADFYILDVAGVLGNVPVLDQFLLEQIVHSHHLSLFALRLLRVQLYLHSEWGSHGQSDQVRRFVYSFIAYGSSKKLDKTLQI